jgi:hypothetical protein
VITLAAGAAMIGAACASDECGEGPFGGATCTYGAEITTGDTLIFLGETVVYTVVAIYGVGPGAPQTVRWSAEDPSVIEIDVRIDGTASVEAIKEGTSRIYVLVNEEFRDSAVVTVVPRGGVLWENTYAGAPTGLYAAIGEDSLIRVVTGGASPLLWLLAPESGNGTSAPSCFSTLGPSLGGSDVAYASGIQCTRQHAKTGGNLWTAPVGGATLGVAVVSDGGAITVTADSVYRVSSTGTVLWGLAAGGATRTAPVLGPEGEVYIGWSVGGKDSVSRIGLDGTPRWSAEVPGLSPGTPAATDARLIFGRPGGIFVIDPNGAVVWDRSFSAVNPAATATSETSSPVHDDVVIYAQNEEALYAYGIGGTFVWAADSLGFGDANGPVGAPVLLADGTLVVPCAAGSVRGVCGVRQINGNRVWRSPAATGTVGGLAVGANGMIYVTRALAGGDGQVAALWGRVPALTTGWPAEGGNPQHTRRR